MAAKTASLAVNIIANAKDAVRGFGEANSALRKFYQELSIANDASTKFKVAQSNAFDYVKKNAILFATGAAAAIGTFVANSVMRFQDLALSIGKFSDATGFSLEEASRLIEVAGDIGIEMGTLEKSIGFMNKTLGNNATAFKELGVQIAYTSGGAVDANKTFLNVVDYLNRIEDPAAKAAAGAKLLGRGWQEMAELIGMGSQQISKSMKEVNDAKVMTEEQRRNAQEFRQNVDNLKDSFEEFSISIGRTVVPGLSDAVGFIDKVVQSLDKIPGASQSAGQNFSTAVDNMRNSSEKANIFTGALELAVKKLWPETQKTAEVTMLMETAWKHGYQAMIDAVSPAQNLNSEIEKQQQLLEDAKYAWDLFKGNLSMELERQGLVSDIEAFRAKWAGSTDEAKRKSQEYRDELLRLQIQVANFGGETIRTATIATQNKIRVLVETGQLEKAVQLLQYIRNNTLGYVETPTATYAVTPYGAMPGRAAGGIITKPEVSVVGEAGAEAIIPLTNPTRAMELMQASGLDMLAMNNMRGGGGQTVIQIQVDAGLVSSPDQVGQQIIDAIRRAERRSGQVFVGV